MTGDTLLERLAALEHDQWVEWSKNVADDEDLSDERVDRWESYWKPYDELDDETKEHDREWARKVLEVLGDGYTAPAPDDHSGDSPPSCDSHDRLLAFDFENVWWYCPDCEKAALDPHR